MLPVGSTLNQSITTPEQHLGWEVGSRHARYHEVVSYARLLCEQSERMTWQSYGQTLGLRPLGVVIFSSPDRQSQFDAIVKQRHAWAYRSAKTKQKAEKSDDTGSDTKNTQLPPSVGWLGYSVHGDEAGAVNASILMMYLLAAAEGPWIDAIMEKHLLLVVPGLNPDGIDRFAQWVNDHRGLHAAADSQDIEHLQGWPRGRTNHYGFDLNRDWLPATQPESQGRLELFYRWLPNLVLDFHEMGNEQSLFFQPGIEGRDHPMSPAFVRDITQGFAKRYASEMDAVGQRYFTREKYDDFYPGKGSTYPDLHGGVGILVEQGSTRGLIHEYASASRHFEETIANPLRLSIASVSGLQEFHRPLLEYQRDFYSTQRTARLAEQPVGYAIAIPKDRRIAEEFIQFMRRHRLEMFGLNVPLVVEDRTLDKGKWWIVPSDQRQGLFLQAIMDRTNEFPFSKFYDVSAWNMADAFGLEWLKLSTQYTKETLGSKVSVKELAFPKQKITPLSVAIAIPGHSVHIASMIERLQQKGIPLRMSMVDCRVTDMNDAQVDLQTGSVILHRADQNNVTWGDAVMACEEFANRLQLETLSIKSSLTDDGPDLGSDNFPLLQRPVMAMLVGDGANVSAAGSLWYTLDRLLQLPVSRIEARQLTADRLAKYNVLWIPDGDRAWLNASAIDALRNWVNNGGHLFLLGGSVVHLDSIAGKHDDSDSPKAILSQVDGIILDANLDSKSFLAKSTGKSSVKVFQNDALWSISSNATLRLSKTPLVAGYLTESDQRKIASTSVLGAHKIGKGLITSMTFDPTFRAHYWSTISLLPHLINRAAN